MRRCKLAAAALAALMAGCSGDSPTATPGPVDLGEKIYMQNCVPCHRDDGTGVPTVYPSLSHSPVVNGDPKALAQWVLNGKRPPNLPSGRYSTQMLLFGWMKDEEAAALLTYVRAHFGNDSPPVAPATVAEARKP
ncbi:MAG TPA: cytochrome c [Steroidobacteraceae bacterium]